METVSTATTYLTNQISALSPRSGRWRKAWGVSPRDRGARSLSLRSGRKPFQRNCSLMCYRPLRGLGVCWASPPGAYAPGFTPAFASRTQARLLIRQVCDYPKEPLAKLSFSPSFSFGVYGRATLLTNRFNGLRFRANQAPRRSFITVLIDSQIG